MQICPHCGAVWPGGTPCPECHTPVTARLPLAWLRYVVLGLALGGLGWVLYAWRGVPAPHATIAQLTQGHPVAYVEIQGVVARSPHYAVDTQQLNFWVADDTGQVPVVAFGAVTQALSQTQGLPQVGDQVTLAGSVQRQAETLTLRVNTAQAVSRTAPIARPVMLGALSPDLILQAIEVVARVVAVREVTPGLTTVLIEDDTGQATVLLEAATRALSGPLPALRPGDVVQVVGVVTRYQAELQITLRATQDLQVLPAETGLPSSYTEPEALTPIAQVRVGGLAKVAGVITDVQSLPFGFAFTLADDSGDLQLVVRETLYAALTDTARLQRGTRVQAFGLVRLLDGVAQLTPETAQAIQVLVPGTPPSQTVPIAALGLAQVGQTFTISATVVATQTFGAGQRFTVQDATGTLTLQLWENLLGYLPPLEQWPAKQSLQVTGRLTTDEGQLVLVPQLGSDVVLQK